MRAQTLFRPSFSRVVVSSHYLQALLTRILFQSRYVSYGTRLQYGESGTRRQCKCGIFRIHQSLAI